MADIDVQLYLIANDDIGRLENALAGFHGDVEALASGGRRGGGGGAGPARMSTSHGVPSQMAPGERMAWNVSRGAMTSPFGAGPPGTGGGGGSGGGGGGGRFGMGNGGWKRFFTNDAGTFDPMETWASMTLAKSAIGGAMGAPMRLFGGIERIAGMQYGGGYTTSGTQLGLSNSNGPFGMGIGSSAWQQGVLNSIMGNIQGTFGGNPFAPQGIALAGQSGYNPGGGVLQALGLSSNTNVGSAVSSLAGSALKAGATEDVTSQWIESLRYGSSSLGALNGRIKQLADFSKAAHTSVGAFTSQLQQTADQMQTNLGVSNFQAGKQVSALSAATGMTPGLLGQITSDPSNMWLAVAQAGGDPYTALQGSQGGMNMVAAFGSKILGFIGASSWQEAANMIGRPGSPQYKAIWDKLFYAYQAKLIPMPPQQAIALITRLGRMTNARAGYSAMMNLQNLGQNANVSEHGPLFTKMVSQLRSSGLLPAHQIDSIINKHEDASKKVSDLMHAVGLAQGGLTDQAAQGNVTKIELTGYAKELFRIAKQDANQHAAQARTAAVRKTVISHGGHM